MSPGYGELKRNIVSRLKTNHHKRPDVDSSGGHKVTVNAFRISRITLSQIGVIFEILYYLADLPNTFKHYKVKMTQFKDKLQEQTSATLQGQFMLRKVCALE